MNNTSNTAGIYGLLALATIVGILAFVLLRRKRTNTDTNTIYIDAEIVQGELVCTEQKQ